MRKILMILGGVSVFSLILVGVLSSRANAMYMREAFVRDSGYESGFVNRESRDRTPNRGSRVYCLQVITPARNSNTGQCVVFPNSCIPLGWVKDAKCGSASSVVAY